jgi:hypothetical protein
VLCEFVLQRQFACKCATIGKASGAGSTKIDAALTEKVLENLFCLFNAVLAGCPPTIICTGIVAVSAAVCTAGIHVARSRILLSFWSSFSHLKLDVSPWWDVFCRNAACLELLLKNATGGAVGPGQVWEKLIAKLPAASSRAGCTPGLAQVAFSSPAHLNWRILPSCQIQPIL